MPKIETNPDGGFLLDGFPKRLTAYDVMHSGNTVNPSIIIYELGTNRQPIAQAPLDEWTDVNDAGFATINDFYTYLSTSLGFFLSASGGGGGATWGSITGDIYNQADLTPLVSDIIVNGNLSYNEFNGNLQIVNNAIEYYGCGTILKAGIYNTVEIPYKNRNITSGNGNIFIFILDQDDVTIGYQKLLVGTGGDNEGVLEITFDTPFDIPSSGIYQFLIGRRNFASNNRRIDLFHKDVNSTDGSVFIAYGSSNPSLDTNDPSAVDWSTINKQNYNRIPKALIYKS